ncbi:MAG: MgtC/SapB family protein [Flammeovirgaceae bacterium]
MFSDLFINLLLAVVFGATVGLERESNNPNDPHVGGIRTFSLIALLGAMAGIFFQQNYTAIGLVIIIGFLALLIAYYVSEAVYSKDFGITSEVSAIITFILAMMVMINLIPQKIVIAIYVIVVFVLSLKSRTTQLVAGLSKQEVQSFISYAIIALVALPALPDHSYQFKDFPFLQELLLNTGANMGEFANLDLINPRKIWMVVVLITGIDVFGYILGRLVGTRNGFALTSFMAGFVSSTSATQSLAQRSTKTKFVYHLVGAALLANLASFLQIILLVGPLNMKWLLAIIPSILLMVLAAGVLAWYFFQKKAPAEVENPESKKATAIFSIAPALKFAGLIIIIKIVTNLCLVLFGQTGFIISSIIASFAGLDAIIVNLADMAGKSITFEFALLTLLIVNATNLMSKSFYSWLQGDRGFAFKFLISAVIIAASGAVWLVFN